MKRANAAVAAGVVVAVLATGGAFLIASTTQNAHAVITPAATSTPTATSTVTPTPTATPIETSTAMTDPTTAAPAPAPSAPPPPAPAVPDPATTYYAPSQNGPVAVPSPPTGGANSVGSQVNQPQPQPSH